MNRRTFLKGSVGVGTVTAIAGCMRQEDIDIEEDELVQDLSTPQLGNEDSNVELEIFEDFTCPHCATFHQDVFPLIYTEFIQTDLINYKRYDFLVTGSEMAAPAANVARHVQKEAGNNNYWEFKDYIYSNQNSINRSNLVEEAVNEYSLDENETQYASHGVYDLVIAENQQYGEQIGATGTPNLFINQEQVELSFEEITRRINEHL